MRQLMLTLIRCFSLLVVYSLLTACGGGNVDSSSSTNINNPSNQPPTVDTTYITLKSDTGDYIGAGNNYSYTQANTQITVSSTGSHLTIAVKGNENWTGDFQLPDSYTELQVGSYPNLTLYPFHDPAVGGLSWSGEGRGCNTLTGWLIINSVTYTGNNLSTIDLSFEQHCEGNTPALHGDIHWTAADPTVPPGPVVPPPTTLWQPDPAVLPTSGNYVYLESETGDYIGAGGNYSYTQANAVLSVTTSGGHLAVSINGNESWNGDFQTMNSINQLETGYYGNLQRYPFNNPTTGGLSWYGQGRGCNTLTGWFVVDSVTYVGVDLTAIDLRFEQHCEGGVPALHGKIHWSL